MRSSEPCAIEPGRAWPESWQGSGRWPRDGRQRPLPLAVLITLAQLVGTWLAARNEPGSLDPLGYALLAAGGLALAFRYRRRLLTLVVVGAVTLAYTALAYPSGPTFVALIVAGLGAVKAGQRYPVWVLTAAGYAAWLVLTGPSLRQALVLAAWVVGLLVVGEMMRVGEQQQAQAAAVRRERARAQEEQQRRQASEERLRIAQELHDVLGHHLSLINVQAGVGLHLMDGQPEQARAALGTIKQASAEALREVRAVLASLNPTGQAPRTPAAGLDQLAELTVDAGLPVDSVVVGRAIPLPPELDRAAYRIVREALTNVRRHAGVGATVTVRVEYREDELVLRIDDDGGEAESVTGPVAEGTGISGMRERVAPLGGSLTAGPCPEGGFRVTARLPLPGGDGGRAGERAGGGA